MKTVQVLLSSYNGEKYIDEQIKSLIEQEGVKISILVRDDGSSDSTITKLEKWQKLGYITWYTGKNLKPALSFMDLVWNAPPADYYAFCDQDDVWDKNKLKVAIEMLEEYETDKPNLYFSRTKLVDANLNTIKASKRKSPKITLGSALIINPATGCTEVFNHRLIEILKQYSNTQIYMHDGWIYRVAVAIGANVVFDENAYISYRQHENNVVGGNSSFYKKYKRRIKNLILERNRIREMDAMQLLLGYEHLITEHKIEQIKLITEYRKSIITKIKLITSKEIKTNNLEYNVLFVIAVLFNAF